jgi:hypothetical protein
MYKTVVTSFAEGVLTRRGRWWQRLEGKIGDGEAEKDSLFRVLVTTLVLQVDYNSPQATDDRDRVFAVLQVADDAAEFERFPDYSMSSQKVYEETALTMLKQGHVDVMAFAQFPKKLQGLPSWVPDWSMQVRMPSCHVPWVNKFAASGNSAKPPVIRSVRPGAVSFRGFMVDSVKLLGSVWDPDWVATIDAAAALRFMQEIEDFCQDSERTKQQLEMTGGQFDIAKSEAARIAIVDIKGANSDNPFWPKFAPVLQNTAKSILEEQVTALKDGKPLESLELYQDVYLRLMKQLHSRRPLATDTGFVGLAPSNAEPGDDICVFEGSRIAYVVRKREDDEFCLVGEAYVHGVMYGELAEGAKFRDIVLV